MKVRVTRQDITEGREKAESRCGCPIYLALCRKLRTEVEIPNVARATIGRIKIPLPESAIAFQERLIKNPQAEVKPFAFETSLQYPV